VNIYFYEEAIHSKYVLRYLASLVVRQMQIKTTMRFHYTCIRITNIKNTAIPNVSEAAKKLDH
jgi:hypothetical protein